jgi:hypothetical protein
MEKKKEFIKDIHYYLENGYVIFTKKYLSERLEGCCKNSCRHCPYDPPREIKGNKMIKLDKNG